MNQTKGSILIELLVSFGIAAILLSSLSIMVVNSVQSSDFSKNQNITTQYAQEGIEMVRKIRDSDYATFLTLVGSTYCLADTCTTLSGVGAPCGIQNPSCPVNVSNKYTRLVTISNNWPGCTGSGTVAVIAKVIWSDTSCQPGVQCKSSSLVTCYTNTNTVTAP